MRRREFISLLGGAATAWPVVARGQQPALPVVGFLGVASDRAERLAAFKRGLGESGFVEGQNVMIEARWAEGRYDRFPELAADLVRHRVAVIAAPGSQAAAIALKSTIATIPIVFAVADDPVKLGLVASLSRPGGNVTGINFFTTEIVAKRLALLRELLPAAMRVAALINPSDETQREATERQVETAARALGLETHVIHAANRQQIDEVFAALARERPDALFVGPDGFFNSRRVQLAILAARYALPTTFAVRDYVEVGGLMSYGTNINDAYRQVGVYTGLILKGRRPADLPVLQSTAFELVINLNTARALGLDIPPTLLARTDEVIE
jgi:putative ABC transport system substrate-binding protein